jgi:hypothetical protein
LLAKWIRNTLITLTWLTLNPSNVSNFV